MNDAETIVTELSRDFHRLKQLVEGNGSKEGSLAWRLSELEKNYKLIMRKLDKIAARPCRDPCLWETWRKKEEQMREKRRTWRIGDIANYIQLLVLLLMAYGIFK